MRQNTVCILFAVVFLAVSGLASGAHVDPILSESGGRPAAPAGIYSDSEAPRAASALYAARDAEVSRSLLSGMDEAGYAKLFLDAADLPPGFKKVQDVRNEKPDPSDRKWAEFKGRRQGFVVWMAKDSKAMLWRIVDVRLVFPGPGEARSYLNSSLKELSEGMPELANPPKLGENCRVFGPHSREAELFGINLRSYIFVFQRNNVVVKLYVAQGDDSKTELTPAPILPIGRKILDRIDRQAK